MYLEHLGEFPNNDSKITLSNFFVRLYEKDPKLSQNIVAAFIKEIRKKVEDGKISPNTFPI